jgi:nucleoside-diphosphate-sugar epimerase
MLSRYCLFLVAFLLFVSCSVVKGCDYVLHTASPFPMGQVSDPDQIIKPAVEGTMSVMRACADSGSVKRVVLTSSVAAIMKNASGTTDRQSTV